MLLEIGIADAYGACFEMTDREFIDRNNDLRYEVHPRVLKAHPEDQHLSLVPMGGYTDDTQMALAVAEAMLDPDEPWTKASLADRFVDAFRRDERRGYTPYFLNVLLNSNTGTDLMSRIGGNSTKSGGAMRAGPLGLYDGLDELRHKATVQASVTHDSWLGKNSAIGAAMMVHYFYHDIGPKDKLVEWLRDEHFGDSLHSPEPFEIDGEIVMCWSPDGDRKVRVHAWDCLEAAIYAVEAHDDTASILQQCIAYGGDVDTVAVLAVGPASCSREIEQNLPPELISGLENKTYGRDYLVALDQKLFARFPKTTAL